MADVKIIMETYGVNYALTMERFMRQEKMYVRILGMLFKDESLGDLRQALQAKNLDGAFQAAHTLKGVCGNLSMHILYDLLTRQVDAFRGGDWAAAVGLMDAVRPAYVELVEAIRRVYGDGRP